MPADEVCGDERLRSVAERRTEQIANAAVALFSERGYVQTTIEDISNEVGVGKGLIYRYFEDKREVLFSALCAVLDKYRKENIVALLKEVGPLEALKRVLAINCTISQEHAPEVILAYRSTKDLMPEQRRKIKEIETEIVGEIRQCLDACIRAGLMHPFDVKIMGYQYLMFGHMWALKNWALNKDFTVYEFVAAGEKLLIVPFLTESGRRKMKISCEGPAKKERRARTR